MYSTFCKHSRESDRLTIHIVLMSLDACRVATSWLSALASALQRGDVPAVATLFLPDGWLRDILVFSWDLHTLDGRDKIISYLTRTLRQKDQVTNVRLDGAAELAPGLSQVPLWPGMSCVDFGFQFDLPYGHGRGFARLTQDTDDAFRAITVLFSLQDLHGAKETAEFSLRDDFIVMPGRDMETQLAEWVHEVETKPHVLIGVHRILIFALMRP